ncbi:MAG: hypothetical protein JW850_17205, partial [Thermoflexales bacterium]|nr:hypothetical protein [Thermoflexales bacterium]
AATLGPQAAVEWIGGKEGDDMIFIALTVPGGYYDTRTVVRGGQELIGGRTYITPWFLVINFVFYLTAFFTLMGVITIVMLIFFPPGEVYNL